ncbi:hypothetical protein NUW54_g9945 [Trametes sanguinea]|uniref:Uncharacterized protein n=1 Tax=Trametes sanguinea TaxID=158606 RepID=A0ACC1P520_9APHY|nr:hypothetical protein NUW54_g9945 [Trametes sanguinea]
MAVCAALNKRKFTNKPRSTFAMEQQAKAPQDIRNVVNFLRSSGAGMKIRVGVLNGKRVDYFKGKGAVKALLSPAYQKPQETSQRSTTSKKPSSSFSPPPPPHSSRSLRLSFLAKARTTCALLLFFSLPRLSPSVLASTLVLVLLASAFYSASLAFAIMHSPRTRANAPVQPLAVSATPAIGEKILKSRFSEDVSDAGTKNHHQQQQQQGGGATSSSILSRKTTPQKSNLSLRSAASGYSKEGGGGGGLAGRRQGRGIPAPEPIITISHSQSSVPGSGPAGSSSHGHGQTQSSQTQGQTPEASSNANKLDAQTGLPAFAFSHNPSSTPSFHSALHDEDTDYVTVDIPTHGPVENAVIPSPRADKAARVLGIRQRQSMEPIPGSNRNSLASARSAPPSVSAPPPTPTGPTMPLASLYVSQVSDEPATRGRSRTRTLSWACTTARARPGAGGGKRKKEAEVEPEAKAEAVWGVSSAEADGRGKRRQEQLGWARSR